MIKCEHKAFTLIEVMAAMAILSLIVLMLGSVMVQATKAWSAGSDKVTSNDQLSIAGDLICQDLYSAVVDDVFGMQITSDRLCFVTCNEHRTDWNSPPREMYKVVYYQDANKLWRVSEPLTQTDITGLKNGTLTIYDTLSGLMFTDRAYVVMDNLALLRFIPRSEDMAQIPWTYESSASSVRCRAVEVRIGYNKPSGLPSQLRVFETLINLPVNRP